MLYYKLQKISLNLCGSYIDSQIWLKNNKATKNLKNKDDKRFQYASAVVLNYQNIKNNPERVSKIELFINQYNWKEVTFPSHRKNWKRSELNNKSLALNAFYAPYNTEEIRHKYRSKHNLMYKNQVFLLMIIDNKKRHYLSVRKLSTLFRGKTLKNNVDLICLNCFHSYRTKNKLEINGNLCKNYEYYCIKISKGENGILKNNHG